MISGPKKRDNTNDLTRYFKVRERFSIGKPSESGRKGNNEVFRIGCNTRIGFKSVFLRWVNICVVKLTAGGANTEMAALDPENQWRNT